jgi:hypothetical protein
MSTRKMIKVVLSGAVAIVMITSCQLFVPQLPATVQPTTTALPLVLPIPTNTSTALPVSTNTATRVPASETPTSPPYDFGGQLHGTPVPEWKGIPVMPGGILGGENYGSYAFTTMASQSEVGNFYTQWFTNQGWRPKAGNETPVSGFLMLVFYKGQGQGLCMVTLLLSGGVTVVFLNCTG